MTTCPHIPIKVNYGLGNPLKRVGFFIGDLKVKSLRKQKHRFTLKEHQKSEITLGAQIGEAVKKLILKDKRQGGLLSK